MARLVRVWVWTDLKCRAGSVKLAVSDRMLSATQHRQKGGDELVTLGFALSDPLVGHLLERRVLRLVFRDDTWEEWRITGVDKEHQTTTGLMCVVRAAPISRDLAENCLVTRVEADGAARQDFEAPSLAPVDQIERFILESLTREGFTHYLVGTIEATDPVDMVYKRSTPLAAIQGMTELTNPKTEFQLRRVGETGYAIDLVEQIGAGAPIIDFRAGKNLRSVKRSTNTDAFWTRVHGSGTEVEEVAATVALNNWIVSARAAAAGAHGGDLLTLEDPSGIGPGPLIEDDQLNDKVLYHRCQDLRATITDSVLATQQLEVAAGTLIAVGDRVEIQRNLAGEQLLFVESPQAIAIYGIKVGELNRPDIPETINLVPNPAMRIWTRASNEPPDQWGMICSDGETTYLFGEELAALGYGSSPDDGGGYGEVYG